MVFLNEADLVEAPELIESELRELLSEYGFPGNDILIINASILKALGFDGFYFLEVKPILRLMDAIEAGWTKGRKKKSWDSSPRPTCNMRRPGRGLPLKHKLSKIKLTTVMSI